MPTGPTEFIRAVRDGFPDGADGGPQYRRLADLVRELIENGELARGSRLPSERELADAASVSRTTVIAAYNCFAPTRSSRARVVSAPGSRPPSP